jgi:predicted nucleotidyltransferase
MNIIEMHKEALINLCQKHHVKSLCVFGSALRNDFNETSDIDFSVLFDRNTLKDPNDFGENYLDFILNLEKEFNRSVDVVNEENLKNPYFASVLNKTKQLLYAA